MATRSGCFLSTGSARSLIGIRRSAIYLHFAKCAGLLPTLRVECQTGTAVPLTATEPVVAQSGTRKRIAAVTGRSVLIED